MHILITGGAGFIGSNLSKVLIQKGHQVTLLDSISPQIHKDGIDSFLVKQLPTEVTLVVGDVCKREDWLKVLPTVDVIVHLAAETGTGQSMYQIEHYSAVNIGGTSLMLDLLTNTTHSVKKVIVASSRAIYGEGTYTNDAGNRVYPPQRNEQDMLNGQFDPIDTENGKPLRMELTDETSKIHPTSVYGITKQVQEQLVLTVCGALGIDAIAYRYQNVYGPGQSLTNPYTGILSIFSNLLLNNQAVNIFEDGLESRDFVYIDDVVNATVLGIEHPQPINEAFNIGTGTPTTVMEVAQTLQALYGTDSPIAVTGNFRIGDIRHNAADIRKATKVLGYTPKTDFKTGVAAFAAWVQQQKPEKSDAFEQSLATMAEKGLLK